MATAELAVAMPALVVVLVLALSAVGAGIDQVRCLDAARATARALARGDTQTVAVGHGRGLAPVRADFAVSTGPSTVRVRVSSPPPRLLAWAGITVRPAGSAVAAREDAPGVAP